MKHWQKLLRRARASDRDRVEKAIKKILGGDLPSDTIKLQGVKEYRARVGNWRIQFHFEDGLVMIDDVSRRNENTYR